MPFGSVFHKLKYIELTTADERYVKVQNNLFTRMGLLLFGLPHIGLRLRARKITKNIPNTTIKKMLDAGCGTGVYSFSLANKVKSIDAIDIEESRISYVKEVNPFSNINFQIGDLCKLKFKSKEFDLIICSDVLEHIKDDKKAFSELARVLKTGGNLLITVPYKSRQNIQNYKYFNHERPGYLKEDILSMCKSNNLSLLKSEGYVFPVTEKLFKFHYNLKKNILLGLLFYPFYMLALLSEKFSNNGEPNGLFCKITK